MVDRLVSMRSLVVAAMIGFIGVAGFWLIAAANDTSPPRSGDMAKFVPATDRRPVPEIAFIDADGRRVGFEDFAGKIVLVNLWATWCAPCVKEMPALDRLQAALGGDDFEVVAISVDRGGRKVVDPFFADLGLSDLSIYLDPQGLTMRGLKPRGLPTSILVGRDGVELGRLEGDAEWDAEEAEALIKYYLRRPTGAPRGR